MEWQNQNGMAWVSLDQKFITHGILHYFHAGFSRDDALANLLKSHEKCPKLFPRIDYRDVDFWYKSFEQKNYNLYQVPEYEPLSKLENLPVLDNVIHRMSAEDQQSMRKVCKTFKNFIDNERRNYDKVELRMSSTSTMLETRSGTGSETVRTVFRMQNEGCEILQNNVRTPCEKNYIRAGLDAFKETIELIHTKVRHMHIQYNPTRIAEKNRREFVMGAAEILHGLKNKLHVETLNLAVHTPEELDAILNGIEPGTLKNVDFDIHDESEEVFKLSEVPNWALHLPSIEEVYIQSNPIDMKIDSFVHIPRVFLEVESVTADEILAHRDKLFNYPTLRSQIFYSPDREVVMETWKNALEPFTPITKDFDEYEDEDEISGSWPIPDNPGHKLIFELELTIKFLIKFKMGRK